MRVGAGLVVVLVVLAGCGGSAVGEPDGTTTTETPRGETGSAVTETSTQATTEGPRGEVIAFSELNSVEQEVFLKAVDGIYVEFNDGDNTYAEYYVREFRDADYVGYNDTYYAVNVSQERRGVSTTYEVRRVTPPSTVNATDFANLTDLQKQVFSGALERDGEYEYVTEGGRSTSVFGPEYVRYEGDLYRVERGVVEEPVSWYTMSVERRDPSDDESED